VLLIARARLAARGRCHYEVSSVRTRAFEGEIDGNHHIHSRHADDGQWKLELVERIDT